MGLKPGDCITLGDLLTATLLGSYNDGANALAQATTGSVDILLLMEIRELLEYYRL